MRETRTTGASDDSQAYRGIPMSGCAHCGAGITAFDIVSRTRTARYHEDCRTRELGLPYEPWFPIRVALALRDALTSLLDSERALGDPAEY